MQVTCARKLTYCNSSIPGLFTNWNFRFDSDPWLHDLQPSHTWAFPICILVLYGVVIPLSFLHEIISPLLNKLPTSIKCPPPKGHEINKPLGGLIEDLQYIKHIISLRIPQCHTWSMDSYGSELIDLKFKNTEDDKLRPFLIKYISSFLYIS